MMEHLSTTYCQSEKQHDETYLSLYKSGDIQVIKLLSSIINVRVSCTSSRSWDIWNEPLSLESSFIYQFLQYVRSAKYDNFLQLWQVTITWQIHQIFRYYFINKTRHSNHYWDLVPNSLGLYGLRLIFEMFSASFLKMSRSSMMEISMR